MDIARQNAEVVRRGYAAVNAADLAALTKFFAEASSWHTPGKSSSASDLPAATPSSGNSAGTEARRTGRSRPRCARSSRATMAESSRSIATLGSAIASTWTSMPAPGFELKAGHIVSGREYYYDLHARDACWS